MNLWGRKILRWNSEDYEKDILRKIELPIDANSHILDVGCGNGADCKLFATLANFVVGIDISIMPRLSKVGNPSFIVADACNLPFKHNFFDIVFEKDVLHHIQDHEKALREMKNAARNSGTVVVVEANRFNPISYLHMTLLKGHQHFTKKYFEKLLTQHFSNIVFKSTESHVYPITSKYLLKMVHKMEDFMAKISLIKNFLSYNIAICKKKELFE